MKLSAQLTFWFSIAFAVLCLGYAAYGWHQLGAMPAGQERDDANGFVYFWAFMGAIGVASAWFSWRMMRDGDG